MKSQRGGFVTGLVVGLLIGLGVALGVALYITKAPVPFINKVPQRSAEQDAAETERNRSWDPNAPLAGKSPARPAVVASGLAAPDSAPINAATGPSPGASAAVAAPTQTTAQPGPGTATGTTSGTNTTAPGGTADAPARGPRDPAAILAGQPAAPAAAAGSAAKPATRPASATVVAFYVQAGAYARPDDADAHRAKLAMLGLAAKITEREQAGRTVYRVRLGPFDAREEAETAQGKLAAAGVEANLVRVER